MEISDKKRTSSIITAETFELIDLLNKIDFQKDYFFNQIIIDKILDTEINKKKNWWEKFKIFNTELLTKEYESIDLKNIVEIQYELYKLIDAINLERIRCLEPFKEKSQEQINNELKELKIFIGGNRESLEDALNLIKINNNENYYLASFSIFNSEHKGYPDVIKNTNLLF
jgi:hypothetical protein